MDSGNLIKIALLGGAAYLLYEWFNSSTSAAAASPSMTPIPATSTVNNTAAIGALFTQFASTINTGDPAVTNQGGVLYASPWTFNYYAQHNLGIASPNPDLSKAFPGADLSQPVSITAYWSAVSPQIATLKGLSGLGSFWGMGHFAGAGRPVQ